VRGIANTTDACVSVVRGEAAPAKLMATSNGFAASHVVATIVFLNAGCALWTSFDSSALELLEQCNFIALSRIVVKLSTRAIIVPLTAVRKACLSFALLACHYGSSVHSLVNLPVSTPWPGTPTEVLQGLQVSTQEERVVGLEDLGYRPSLYLMMLHYSCTTALRACNGVNIALA